MLSFFANQFPSSFFVDYSRKQNQAELEIIYLNNKIRRNTTPKTNKLHLIIQYLSATPILLLIFWAEHDFCIISDCRNSFGSKLKMYEQTKNFFKPANTQPSSEESLKQNRHIFIGMCFLFTCFNIQILICIIDDAGLYSQPSRVAKMMGFAKIVNG